VLLYLYLLLASMLSIKVSPEMAVSFTPLPVTVRARIQPNDQMRAIAATLDDGAYFRRSSSQTISGSNASPLQVFEWRDVPPGEYMVVVEIYDEANRVLARAQHTVRIINHIEP
jgi:hypothetical protein